MKPRALLVLLCIAATPISARAGGLHATYVTPDGLRLERVLPPPPAPGSPEAREDLAAVEAAVRARTPADEARIVADLPCDAGAFAADILGPRFNRSRAPLTFALVDRAFADEELAVIAAKQRIGRPRPYALVPGLATFGHRSDSSSYPSGHAACGRVMAVILAAIAPDNAAALFARGDLYGRNRLMAGTHFPSDLVAGATAGSVVVDALFLNPRFQTDFALARAETRAALQ